MTDIVEAKKLLLAEWERERDELNILIARVRRELGLGASSIETNNEVARVVPAVTSGVSLEEIVAPGDFFGMTQVEAAKEFLNRRKKQAASLQEIASALYRGKAAERPAADDDGAALRNLSSLMSRSGEFVSIARGRWGLAEWYPDRVLKKQRKAKNGEHTADEQTSDGAEPSENPKPEQSK